MFARTEISSPPNRGDLEDDLLAFTNPRARNAEGVLIQSLEVNLARCARRGMLRIAISANRLQNRHVLRRTKLLQLTEYPPHPAVSAPPGRRPEPGKATTAVNITPTPPRRGSHPRRSPGRLVCAVLHFFLERVQ